MKTLAELSYAIKTRRISSEEAVGRALGAADKWQPRLNAFRATYPESAALLARQIDNASEEKATKPLCGVPLAHKDMFDYPGHRSSYGSRIPQEVPAKTAATVVDRLEAAGTVTVGFLSMAEFALGPTGHNTPFRHCRNARDPERISGGSSAGSGAAVGAGIVPASLGSDTGGSVRIPASVNGITGLKPTQAQLSRAGAMLLSPSLDCVGTLARSAEDCGILMAAASGRDLRDPTALSGAFAGNGVFDGRAADPGKLRLGFPKDVSDVDSDVLIALTNELALRSTMSNLPMSVICTSSQTLSRRPSPPPSIAGASRSAALTIRPIFAGGSNLATSCPPRPTLTLCRSGNCGSSDLSRRRLRRSMP